MRSAVSSILGDMSEPGVLCYPDYAQVSSDHRRLLVLVRSVSPASLKPKAFARVFEVLDRCAHDRITVNSADDLTRNIEARFVRSYPAENNDWGEFQHHRAVLGLVSVGTFKSSKQELAELGRLHEALKQKYSKTLLCSRLIALRDDEASPSPQPPQNHVSTDDQLDQEEDRNHDDGDDDESRDRRRHHDSNQDSPTSTSSRTHDKLEMSLSNMDEKSLENDMTTFLTTMFWLLEKARVEKLVMDQSSKIPLMCAPFERKDFVGLDLESRVNKKRAAGRFKKHMGDLSLMCGLIKEAYDYYEVAMETLKSCNDWLWLASAMEGVCAIGTIVHYPDMNRSNSLRRNSSFQTLAGHAGVRRKERRGVETDETFRRRVISPSELVDLLREVVVYYSKYRNAGVMETEASIKAVQVLIAQGNILFAAEFLQNVVFINLQMNDEEKVQRFSALSKLYARLGFRRKAAFFHRVAAMRCVAPQNPHTDWAMCYQMLLKTLPGYNVDFQSTPAKKTHLPFRPLGWPTLQIQIMQELVGTSRRMGDHVAATRHMAFIIQTLFFHLSEAERTDLCHQLTILTSKSPGTPVPHAVEAGVILPPVNIYTLPRIVKFRPCPLVEPLLSPPGVDGLGDLDSPFIFTPIVASQSDSLRRGKSLALHWVQGEVASVEITVINPLSTELRVSSMALLHEGAEFDAFPSAFVLGPETTTDLRLSGIPKEAGMLSLLGYSCVVFGVRSNCRLKSLNLDLNEDHILIEVSPSIPRLVLSVLDQGKSVAAKSGEPLHINAYHGENESFALSLLNASSMTVERLHIEFQTVPSRYGKFLSKTDVGEVIKPGDTVDFTVHIQSPATGCDYHEMDELSSLSLADSAKDVVGLKAKQEQFSLSVVVKYSSNPEASKGYCRQLVHKAVVTFHPSLVITWWDILPGESADECYVVLDVRNLTSGEAELRYGGGGSQGSDKRIVIDAKGTCRVPMPVEKVHCQEKNDEEGERNKFLARYLDQKVSLIWDFLSERRSGKVSLADISLTREMMSRLERSSVSWTVSVNGDKWIGMEHSSMSGEPVSVAVALDNNYSIAIKCRFICRSRYVTEGVSSSSSLTDATAEPARNVPISGSRTFRNCLPGESVTHTGQFIPCLPGKLCINCYCEVFQDRTEEKIDHILIPSIFVNLH